MVSKYERKYMKDDDFEERDIWNVMEETENHSNSSLNTKSFNKNSSISSSSSSSSRHISSTPRMIPRSSSSHANTSNKQFSVPMEIPDWSKIYGEKHISKKKNKTTITSSWVDDDDVNQCHGHYGNCHSDVFVNSNDDGDDDDYDDDDGMVPPHEYLARKLARSQISTFSMCEGIGRTLKGRDLSKLRNAILTKTGFLEQG